MNFHNNDTERRLLQRLEITDEDTIEDDYLDVEEPKHELTMKEARKISKQYDHLIRFTINNNDDNIKIQTSLIPRILKRLDTIFEHYGIEHS